ncbi:MAG: redox-sensing transcriptional repressor Rex [Bacteroidetes bacterium]|nr:redox-sensing transcriptional repressor Rex [Bacteroidota bacterium]
MKLLPDKTVERLSQYRRAMLKTLASGKHHIYSHEIANMLHITPVQVRRDIMLIGYTGTLRHGYDVSELIDIIGTIIDSEEGTRVAVVGAGALGSAIIRYFNGKRTKLSIVAAFDVNPDKLNKVYAGVQCYPFEKLHEIIKRDNIQLALIATPASETAKVAEVLVGAGIKGILNFTPSPINVSSQVYLEEFDMITSLEKVAYFAKHGK